MKVKEFDLKLVIFKKGLYKNLGSSYSNQDEVILEEAPGGYGNKISIPVSSVSPLFNKFDGLKEDVVYELVLREKLNTSNEPE